MNFKGILLLECCVVGYDMNFTKCTLFNFSELNVPYCIVVLQVYVLH